MNLLLKPIWMPRKIAITLNEFQKSFKRSRSSYKGKKYGDYRVAYKLRPIKLKKYARTPRSNYKCYN